MQHTRCEPYRPYIYIYIYTRICDKLKLEQKPYRNRYQRYPYPSSQQSAYTSS